VTRLAQAIARVERGLAGEKRGCAVAQRIFTRMHQQLGKLVGPAGFDVLLGRALVLARRVRPGLAGVTSGPGGKLEGLAELARERAALDDDAMAIVSHFIELLVSLIGEDLAVRMTRDIWPAVADEETR
jgi:hypothetical protein